MMQTNKDSISSPTDEWERIKDQQLFIDPPTNQTYQYDCNACTRILVMSDTHGKHRSVSIPSAGFNSDILIHGGDFTSAGEFDTIRDLSTYFYELLHQHKIIKDEVIVIAGNHDITFETEFYETNWRKFTSTYNNPMKCQQELQNCVYLEDTSYTIRKGQIEIYGSPWSPTFWDWAFNLNRGREILRKWHQIPPSTDILMTHGPPLGRGDLVSHHGSMIRTGCYDLLQEIQHRIKPRIHVFGHIHEGYGTSYDGTTLYVNASNVDLQYNAINPCHVIDLPHDKTKPPILVLSSERNNQK